MALTASGLSTNTGMGGILPSANKSLSRDILAGSPSLTLSDPEIVELARQARLSLISGPMLGEVSESGVTVWFRPVHVEALTVQVTDKEGNKNDFPVDVTRPGVVARVRLAGLSANTQYTYRIASNSGGVLGEGSFRTAPRPDTQETFRIAFGSCFHKIGVHNPNLMRLIAERGNHAMLLLGDLAVNDREDEFNIHYADYLLRDVSKPWRMFSAGIPVYANWDDHDYLNDPPAASRSKPCRGRRANTPVAMSTERPNKQTPDHRKTL